MKKINMNCKEFMEDLENYKEEHPFECFFNQLKYKIKELPSKIKIFYQRHTRGYADCDVWNLNYFILDRLYPPFIAFIRHQETKGKSLPMDFQSDPSAWLVVLSKIEYALTDAWKDEHELDHYEAYGKMTEEQKKEHNEKVKEGFALLGKYMMDLWD